MNLEKLVAVSGLPGVYKMAANRDNGLIIEDMDTGKKRFAPSRRHQFTPLESVAIFTEEDSVELKIIFKTMMEQMQDNPPIPANSKPEVLRNYFGSILPDFDRDKVYPSDIKKVIKWFNYLNDRQLLSLEEEENKEEEE